MNWVTEVRFFSGGVEVTRRNKQRRVYHPSNMTRMTLEDVILALAKKGDAQVNYLSFPVVSFSIV